MSAETEHAPGQSRQELDRLEAIESYDILDTPREEDYDDIVKLAAEVCQMPVSMVSLVADGRQWFKAAVGFQERESSLDVSICKHAIRQQGLFLVPDLTQDQRFSGYSVVTGGPKYRFYAGAVLKTPEGIPIGTLCMLDFKPRELTEKEAYVLKTLARQVMVQLELRRCLKLKSQSEEEVKKGREELRAILDSSLDAIIVFSAIRDEVGLIQDLRFRLINSEAEKMMEKDGASLLGQTLVENFPHVISSGLLQKYILVIQEGETLDIEYLSTSRETPRWLRIVGVKLGDGLVLTYNEITERKKAQDTLRANEERFRLFIDAVQDYALIILDPFGYVISWNAGAERIKGYEAHEIIGRHFSCFYPAEANEKGHPDEELRIAASQGRYVEEGWRVRKDGSHFLADVVITAIYDDQGKLHGFAKVTRDITICKQAEDQLKTSAMRLGLATQALQAGVWDWDIRTNAIEWDDRMYEIYGLVRNVPVDYQLWAKSVVVEDLPRAEATLQSVIAGKLSQASAEFRIILPTGELRYIQAAEGVVLDDAGQVTRVIGVNIDVTARKEIEQQFLRAQRVECIGTLAGGIAHDLNNILSPLLMSIEWLKNRAQDAETIDLLAMMKESATRGADIVRQVLSFARGMEGERIEVSPGRLLKDIGNIVKNTFPKDIRLQCSMADDTWTIAGDSTQIHQVLLNLCVNARDAMPGGGNLIVRIENCLLDDQYAAMNLQAKAGRYIKISVADTGIGIPPEIIDKVFEPFFTTKELNKGSGLGLSTVVGIVKSHQGIIKLNSKPGKGTTFEVYLPAMETRSQSQAQALGHSEDSTESLPQGNGETVLLVDDEESVLKITSKTLQASGYRVLTAKNGANALTVYLANKKDIAVVLTDMMMPVMSGPAMIHALMRINPAIKIIAASGLRASGSLPRASETRVKYSLGKPYTTETLLKTLHAILHEAH